MPLIDIKGKLIEFPDDMSPEDLESAVASAADQMDGVAPEAAKQPTERSLKGFAVNAGRDALANVQGQAEVGAYAVPPLALMKAAQGEKIYDPKRLLAIGEGLANAPKAAAQSLAHTLTEPGQSLYETPFTAVQDVMGAFGAATGVAKLGSMATKAVARRALPGMARASAGAPEKATAMFLKKPSIMDTPALPEDQLLDAVGKPIQQAVQATKERTGRIFGKIYQRIAGMEGPMQEIVDTPTAQKIHPVTAERPVAQKISFKEERDIGTGVTKTKSVPGEMITEKQIVGYKPGEEIALPRKTHSLRKLLVDKNRAERAFANGDQDAMGELFKEYVSKNADPKSLKITDKDKLQILTRIKRETQEHAAKNLAPVTLKPISTAKDAAFSKISARLDELRGQLKGGPELARADDAWKELRDIYDTVQKDISDPGKSKDMMMRLMRGDNTWLTSGKMQIKTNAIKRIEKLTGTKILEPAMEELTRQVFNQDMGTGFFANKLRNTAIGLAGFAGGTRSFGAAAAAAASLAASSPKAIGMGIKGAFKTGKVINKMLPSAAVAGAASTPIITRPLTKDKAMEILKEAKGNKEKARQIAKDRGYEVK